MSAPTRTPETATDTRVFRLPDLGEGLTEAEIVGWRVASGDTVRVDQVVVEVETAKATVELPCPYAGVVAATHGGVGDVLDVGAPLLSVRTADNAPAAPGIEPETVGGATPATGTGESADTGSGQVLVGSGTGAVGRASRRRRVLSGGFDTSTSPPAGLSPAHQNAIASQSPATPRPARRAPVAVISPLVRRMARDAGLDLTALRGTGPDGLIMRRDVERALAAAPPRALTDGAPAPTEPGEATEPERVPLRGQLRMMAEHVTRAHHEIPAATTWVDVDATELLAAKRALADAHPQGAGTGARIGLLPLLARICVAALRRHPELNARVDTARGELLRLPGVHLGIATQTERALIVPVIRDAHRMTTEQLAEEIERLVTAARAGTLRPSELTGSTFTLNNYGGYGVDGSTPLINHPDVAMLGIGRIIAKPWVVDGELAVRQVGQLSLTFDHRAADGAVAGGFLRFVADCVEHPARMLRVL